MGKMMLEIKEWMKKSPGRNSKLDLHSQEPFGIFLTCSYVYLASCVGASVYHYIFKGFSLRGQYREGVSP